MKDLIDAINTRVKEPYWGFFLLAFLAFNWRALFLLCFAKGTAQEKIFLFDDQTTFLSLIVFPIITAVAIMLVTPWLKVLFGWISRSAYERLNSQDLKREHKYLAEKNLLEQERSLELANKEKELIDQAKRDVDIEQINDENTREILRAEIDKLRQERNQLDHNENIKQYKELTIYEKNILEYLYANEGKYIGKDEVSYRPSITIGSKEYVEESNLRDYLNYADALKSLKSKGLIRDVGKEGRIFELENKGKEYMENFKIA
ncbi:hypothetical protein [Acinetobacter sp. Ver3]|uniref:hypothetical protein n=1 Tax=Acinetobacter sp. Ver3 TaxID=466088 RepID=UPI00044E96B0|nr:hypothetical protein [Acinetobacter sp. Ver3]EZQ10221.1 hypothetical protein CL42_08545 [Acinetobacter sp. Ver3]